MSTKVNNKKNKLSKNKKEKLPAKPEKDLKKLKAAYESGKLKFDSKEVAKAMIKDLKPNK